MEDKKKKEFDIVVREYDPSKDIVGVEAVQNSDVGKTTGIHFVQLGDPLCRICNTPSRRMLVAEKVGENKEIVGVIRGTTKTVAFNSETPKVGYILGLHVSHSYRRLQIAFKLVSEIEQWFISEGVKYAYMATGKENIACVDLFTKRCDYKIFHTPDILVQNTSARQVKLPKTVKIYNLTPKQAETFYSHQLSTMDFFPDDIGSILTNPLNIGTCVVVPSGWSESDSWPGLSYFLRHQPESWAVLSAWRCNFKIELHGVSRLKRGLEKIKRGVDWAFPWLKITSYRDVFHPFCIIFLYGLSGSGTRSVELMETLWGDAHNKAKDNKCTLIVTEVADKDPLKLGIPHDNKLSCEDIWCKKKLAKENLSDGIVEDLTEYVAGTSIFVDPREF